MSRDNDISKPAAFPYFPKAVQRVVLVGISLDQQYLGQGLGLYTLSSYIEQDSRLTSVKVEMKFFHAGQMPYAIAGEITQCQADIIGFSCYMWNIPVVLATCTILKEINREPLILLGGPEVTPRARSLLETNPAVDIIVLGEGEKTLAHLLSALRSGSINLGDIKGIAFRRSNEIIETGLPELLENLDVIPIMHTMAKRPKDNRDTVYFSTTRGCPFHCGFCLGGKEGQIRSLSIDRVKHDLLGLIKAECQSVHIIDWTFNHDNERAKTIFQFIIDHNISTTFIFEIRPELLDREALRLLTQLEDKRFMFIFEIGIQSVHPRTLKNIGRNWNKKRTTTILKHLCSIKNLAINFNLLRGLPGDNYKTFKKGIDYLYRFLHMNLDSGVLCLIPGSTLRRDSRILGLEFNRHPPYQVLYTKDSPFSELCQAHDIIETELLLRPLEKRSAPIRKLLRLAPSRYFEIFRKWLEKRIDVTIDTWKEFNTAEAAPVLADFFSDYISGIGIPARDEPEIHQRIRDILCRPAVQYTPKPGENSSAGSEP